MKESNNLPDVKASLERFQRNFDLAVGNAANEISQHLASTAARQIKGSRKSVGYPAISGKPPMNVTGNLRRSIKGSSMREGFGIYVAEAGAYMVYARAVELGGAPTWSKGQNFPYMAPALEQFRQSNIIQRTLEKHIRRIQ